MTGEPSHPQPVLLSPPGFLEVSGNRGEWHGRLGIPPGLFVYKNSLRLEWEGEGAGQGTAQGTAQGAGAAQPVVTMEYPPSTVKPDPATGEEVEIYEGEIPLRLFLDFPAPSPAQGKLVLHYQACDATTCFFPARLVHEVVLRARPAGANGFRDAGSPGGSGTPPGGQAGSQEDFSRRLAESGLLLTHLFVFAMGVALSFTPCIFPLIPVTIGIIGARRTTRKSQAFFLSLVYVQGISLTYAVMGVGAAATGALFGSLLQSPWVTGGMVAMFLALALSMFGWFDLNLPAGLREKAASSGGGYSRVFLLGLASGLVASPCVGPVIVGLLLHIGRTGNLFLGFTLLFAFAWGMGLLFVVLGTFSNLLARLPRSGAWMNEVKHGFGLLMVAMAVFYARSFFPEAVHPVIWVAAALLVGTLALTRWRSRELTRGPALLRGTVVVLLLGFGLGQGGRLVLRHELLNPPAGPLGWQQDLGEALALARSSRRPLLVDFYADWCGACHELDRLTFGDRRFRKAVEARDWILVRVDLTGESPAREGLRRQFAIVGLPTVLLFGPDARERGDLRITGFVPEDELRRRMARAAGGE
ncbi:MAG: protein-disulfide reductase DsbD [Planctomycetota bacterium]